MGIKSKIFSLVALIACLANANIMSFFKKGDDMSMIKWRPFEELDAFFSEKELETQGLDLAMDVYEEDGNVIVKMNVPGIAYQDLHIKVEGNELMVSGKREEKKEEEGKSYYHKEIRYGSFDRSVTLPRAVNAAAMIYKLDDGVLTVTIPKA